MNTVLMFSLIYSAIHVILSRSIEKGIIYLTLCYVLSGIYLMSIDLEYIGIILIIIYAGAVAILFILSIMVNYN